MLALHLPRWLQSVFAAVDNCFWCNHSLLFIAMFLPIHTTFTVKKNTIYNVRLSQENITQVIFVPLSAVEITQ